MTPDHIVPNVRHLAVNMGAVNELNSLIIRRL